MWRKNSLHPLRQAGVDTLILGCTHYPLMEEVIAQVMGPDVTLISSAAETAQEAKAILTQQQLLAERPVNCRHRFLSAANLTLLRSKLQPCLTIGRKLTRLSSLKPAYLSCHVHTLQ